MRIHRACPRETDPLTGIYTGEWEWGRREFLAGFTPLRMKEREESEKKLDKKFLFS